MSIVIEYRLHCEFCEAVSPVVYRVTDGNSPAMIPELLLPTGWVKTEAKAPHSRYPFAPGSPQGTRASMHFCSLAHDAAWKALHEVVT